jgi:hypothetical protein
MEIANLIDVITGVFAIIAGWVFRLVLTQLKEMKDEHQSLFVKQTEDYRELTGKVTDLALSLPDKYVNKDDFKIFAERMNDRFDRLEEKIDNLKK